ncbi:MAG TPA: DUF2846 domain-containing protein [Acetobacteraceae bacterium]
MNRLILRMTNVSGLAIALLAAMLLAAMLLAGCATSGVTYTELQPKLAAPAAGQGRIFIYRTIVLGAAVQPSVKLNGVVVGSAVPRGFIYLDRPAGDYTISTETEVTRTLSLTLAGQVRYVKLNIGIGFFVGHVYPELVGDTEGKSDIANCHLVSS